MATMQRAKWKKPPPARPRARIQEQPPAEISPEVAAYCERENLKKELAGLIDLARESFRHIQRIHTRMLMDVDDDREIAIIDVDVDTDQEKLLVMQDHFVSKCVKRFPFETREKIRVIALFPGWPE